jgi:hypothetical protein
MPILSALLEDWRQAGLDAGVSLQALVVVLRIAIITLRNPCSPLIPVFLH